MPNPKPNLNLKFLKRPLCDRLLYSYMSQFNSKEENKINNTRSSQHPKLLSFTLIIHHVLKRTCLLIKSKKATDSLAARYISR